MTSKTVGKVSLEEKEQIENYMYRQDSLIDLLKAIDTLDKNENKELYERIVNDLAEVKKKMGNWWQEKSSKYCWEKHENGQWHIDFKSGVVTLFYS